MTRTQWNWSVPGRSAAGILPAWLRPLSVVSPWLAAGLCFAMLCMAGGRFTVARGVAFDLPGPSAVRDAAEASAVALAMASPRGTLVFFDDTRYALGEAAQEKRLAAQIGERLEASGAGDGTLLVLADRAVPGGDIVRLASLAREGGASKVFLAEKRGGAAAGRSAE